MQFNSDTKANPTNSGPNSPRKEKKLDHNPFKNTQAPFSNTQGAKKIIFTACHSAKLKLAFTCPQVISTSPTAKAI